MNKESSKKIILAVLVIFVAIVVLAGFTYALFTYSKMFSQESTITAGKLKFGYIEETNGVSLQNAMPISDETALNTTDENDYFDFYVTYDITETVNVKYEIDIENVTSELPQVIDNTLTQIDSSRIKIALEDRNVVDSNDPMVVAPTYFSKLEERAASNSKAGYYLYGKTVTGNNSDYYRLYMWIPEVDDQEVDIPMNDTTDGVKGIGNQAFSVIINVQAVNETSAS